MVVEYAVYDRDADDVIVTDGYSAAKALEAERPVDVWLMVDGWPVLKRLPSSFDRLTILPDGTEIRTAVMNGRELDSAWGPEWFGDEALLLTINRKEETVSVYDGRGDVELTYWPQAFE